MKLLLMDAAKVIVEFKYAQGNAVGLANVTGCNYGRRRIMAMGHYLLGRP